MLSPKGQALTSQDETNSHYEGQSVSLQVHLFKSYSPQHHTHPPFAPNTHPQQDLKVNHKLGEKNLQHITELVLHIREH